MLLNLKMNTTLFVASFYNCSTVIDYPTLFHTNDPIWKQTELGCQILLILKDFYGFNIIYVPEYLESNMTNAYALINMTSDLNHAVDIYLRPMSLGLERLEFMDPFHAAYTWKYGFVFRICGNGFYRTFYSKPFTRAAWNCLYAMALFISIFFYILKKWEYRVVGGWNCSYPYEMLMVIGGYCQHIPPIEANLPSRRIAYFVFFIFAYVVYTYYTSNLLSHLVNYKFHDLTLENLLNSGIECAIVDYMMLTVLENIPTYGYQYLTLIKEFQSLRIVSLDEGMKGVMTGKTALLSDYISLLPYFNKLNDQEICELLTVDLFTNIKKYMFASKNFAYKEEFKIGALRAKETGLVKRWGVKQELPSCTSSNTVQTNFEQISSPLLILLITYILSVIIVFIERHHYRRNRVWPFVN